MQHAGAIPRKIAAVAAVRFGQKPLEIAGLVTVVLSHRRHRGPGARLQQLRVVDALARTALQPAILAARRASGCPRDYADLGALARVRHRAIHGREDLVHLLERFDRRKRAAQVASDTVALEYRSDVLANVAAGAILFAIEKLDEQLGVPAHRLHITKPSGGFAIARSASSQEISPASARNAATRSPNSHRAPEATATYHHAVAAGLAHHANGVVC